MSKLAPDVTTVNPVEKTIPYKARFAPVDKIAAGKVIVPIFVLLAAVLL